MSMRILRMFIPIPFFAAAFVSYPQTGPAKDLANDDIAGVWRGNSNCMVKNSPCHDEINVYRIAKVSGKPEMMKVTGSKIVDGKEVVMGSSDWKYDAQKHTLDSSDGAIHLDIAGNKIEGALTLRDKTVYRRIHLKKED